MDKPKITFIAAAVRPQYWQEIYDNLNKSNDIPFEIIYIGNVKPDFELPDNFRYIYSEVKPVQCNQAAIMMAKGEYIFTTSDDYLYSKDFIRTTLKWADKYDMNKTFIAPQGTRRWKRKVKGMYLLGKYDWPITGQALLMKKEILDNLKLDNRFVSCCWHYDTVLRFYGEMGGDVVIADDCFYNEENRGSYLRNLDCTKDDVELVYKLWHDKKKNLLPTRQDEVREFEGDAQFILEKTQGAKGIW